MVEGFAGLGGRMEEEKQWGAAWNGAEVQAQTWRAATEGELSPSPIHPGLNLRLGPRKNLLIRRRNAKFANNPDNDHIKLCINVENEKKR